MEDVAIAYLTAVLISAIYIPYSNGIFMVMQSVVNILASGLC